MPYNIKRLDLNALPCALANGGALPDFPVLYIIFDPSQVFYVGATKSLFNRWSGHRADHRIQNILKRKNVKVAWIRASVEQFAEFECALIQFLNPKINCIRKGKTYHYMPERHNKNRCRYQRLADDR